MKKRIIAILLIAALVMIVSAGARGVVSAEEDPGAVPAAGTETEADTADEEETQDNVISLTTIDGTAWSISYPPTFTYEEGASYQGGLGQKNEKKRGVIQGDFQVGICDGEVYPNVYENVAALNAQFKKSTIYEERELGGVTAYISQNKEASMKVIIGYTDTNYICLNIISEGGDYQAIYEGEALNEILDSISFGADEEAEALTSEQGYVSVTPVGGWYQGDSKSNNAITLYNDGIGPVSWAIFDDIQLSTVEKLKENILFGYSSYSFEPQTIGNNTYEVLDANSVVYLVAPTSTGKGLKIELRNVTIEQAMELLETVEIR